MIKIRLRHELALPYLGVAVMPVLVAWINDNLSWFAWCGALIIAAMGLGLMRALRSELGENGVRMRGLFQPDLNREWGPGLRIVLEPKSFVVFGGNTSLRYGSGFRRQDVAKAREFIETREGWLKARGVVIERDSSDPGQEFQEFIRRTRR